jgi:hypothetical protein
MVMPTGQVFQTYFTIYIGISEADMNILRKFQKPETSVITVVSGLPRSGTSMMMKMLEAGGIMPLTDKIREADIDNPNGYYEWERAKKLPEGDIAWLNEAKGKSVKIISALLTHLPPGYQYKVIFLHREMGEILASQREMLIRRNASASAEDDDTMTMLFEKHLQEITTFLAARPDMDVLYVNYNEILASPLKAVQEVDAFMNRPLNVDAMVQVVDRRLHRQKSS